MPMRVQLPGAKAGQGSQGSYRRRSLGSSLGSGLWILVFNSIKPSNDAEGTNLRLSVDAHQSETDLVI